MIIFLVFIIISRAILGGKKKATYDVLLYKNRMQLRNEKYMGLAQRFSLS